MSGDRIEAVYMIPGWTHNIINLSESEDLVTVMTCNEVFDVALCVRIVVSEVTTNV